MPPYLSTSLIFVSLNFSTFPTFLSFAFLLLKVFIFRVLPINTVFAFIFLCSKFMFAIARFLFFQVWISPLLIATTWSISVLFTFIFVLSGFIDVEALIPPDSVDFSSI